MCWISLLKNHTSWMSALERTYTYTTVQEPSAVKLDFQIITFGRGNCSLLVVLQFDLQFVLLECCLPFLRHSEQVLDVCLMFHSLNFCLVHFLQAR